MSDMFAPEVRCAVDEINRRFPEVGEGGTYPGHGADEPGGLPSEFYAADFWTTDKTVHDRVFRWIIDNALRLNLKLVISWERIWSVERADEGVRPYLRYGLHPKDPYQGHRNHVHTEFEEKGFYMPSIDEIRKVIRDELRSESYLRSVGVAVGDADVVPNVWGDPKNVNVRLKSALVEIGNDANAIRAKLQA